MKHDPAHSVIAIIPAKNDSPFSLAIQVSRSMVINTWPGQAHVATYSLSLVPKEQGHLASVYRIHAEPWHDRGSHSPARLYWQCFVEKTLRDLRTRHQIEFDAKEVTGAIERHYKDAPENWRQTTPVTEDQAAPASKLVPAA